MRKLMVLAVLAALAGARGARQGAERQHDRRAGRAEGRPALDGDAPGGDGRGVPAGHGPDGPDRQRRRQGVGDIAVEADPEGRHLPRPIVFPTRGEWRVIAVDRDSGRAYEFSRMRVRAA